MRWRHEYECGEELRDGVYPVAKNNRIGFGASELCVVSGSHKVRFGIEESRRGLSDREDCDKAIGSGQHEQAWY